MLNFQAIEQQQTLLWLSILFPKMIQPRISRPSEMPNSDAFLSHCMNACLGLTDLCMSFLSFVLGLTTKTSSWTSSNLQIWKQIPGLLLHKFFYELQELIQLLFPLFQFILQLFRLLAWTAAWQRLSQIAQSRALLLKLSRTGGQLCCDGYLWLIRLIIMNVVVHGRHFLPI